MMRSAGTRLSLFVGVLLVSRLLLLAEEVATFPSGQLALYGVLYKPQGTGPFAGSRLQPQQRSRNTQQRGLRGPWTGACGPWMSAPCTVPACSRARRVGGSVYRRRDYCGGDSFAGHERRRQGIRDEDLSLVRQIRSGGP